MFAAVVAVCQGKDPADQRPVILRIAQCWDVQIKDSPSRKRGENIFQRGISNAVVMGSIVPARIKLLQFHPGHIPDKAASAGQTKHIRIPAQDRNTIRGNADINGDFLRPQCDGERNSRDGVFRCGRYKAAQCAYTGERHLPVAVFYTAAAHPVGPGRAEEGLIHIIGDLRLAEPVGTTIFPVDIFDLAVEASQTLAEILQNDTVRRHYHGAGSGFGIRTHMIGGANHIAVADKGRILSLYFQHIGALCSLQRADQNNVGLFQGDSVDEFRIVHIIAGQESVAYAIDFRAEGIDAAGQIAVVNEVVGVFTDRQVLLVVLGDQLTAAVVQLRCITHNGFIAFCVYIEIDAHGGLAADGGFLDGAQKRLCVFRNQTAQQGTVTAAGRRIAAFRQQDQIQRFVAAPELVDHKGNTGRCIRYMFRIWGLNDSYIHHNGTFFLWLIY